MVANQRIQGNRRPDAIPIRRFEQSPDPGPRTVVAPRVVVHVGLKLAKAALAEVAGMPGSKYSTLTTTWAAMRAPSGQTIGLRSMTGSYWTGNFKIAPLRKV
jgi:hypothetical protein